MRIPFLCALTASLLAASNPSNAGAFDEAGTMAAQAAATPATPAAAPTAPAKEALFGPDELAQIVAPIALYPDPLLAQVLMGATYPGDVADAAKWSKAHPDEKGETAVTKVADQPWDPSVQALVAFPQVLDMLGQDPAWVQKLGDAFLAQSNDVMDAVQKLRRQAQDAGNLSSNEQQKVSTQPVTGATTSTGIDGETVIVIEPSEPDVIYVPSYNPTTIYGSWAYPYYPPMYYPPPAYYYPGGAFAAGIIWGAAIAGGCWGNVNWGGGDINIDVDRYNNINRNNQINRGDKTWNHNAANRDGVPYRDKANRERNGRQMDGAGSREGFRGENAQRSQQRNQARNTMSDRGIKPATSNVDARNQARTAQQQRGQYGGQGMSNSGARNSARDLDRMNTQPHNNAFRDASRPSSSNMAQQRGNYSRNSASRPASSRPASRPVSRPSRPPMRSGGGGRRR